MQVKACADSMRRFYGRRFGVAGRNICGRKILRQENCRQENESGRYFRRSGEFGTESLRSSQGNIPNCSQAATKLPGRSADILVRSNPRSRAGSPKLREFFMRSGLLRTRMSALQPRLRLGRAGSLRFNWPSGCVASLRLCVFALNTNALPPPSSIQVLCQRAFIELTKAPFWT